LQHNLAEAIGKVSIEAGIKDEKKAEPVKKIKLVMNPRKKRLYSKHLAAYIAKRSEDLTSRYGAPEFDQ